MHRLPVLLFLSLFSFGGAAKTLEFPRPNQTWTTVKADELTFISNASDSVTTNIVRELLRMRAAVGEITMLRVRSSLPTTVFVFANERSFAPYRDAVFGPDSDDITGVFLSTESGNFILLRGDSASGVDRVVFHELTHYFVRNTMTALPAWLNEGFAEFYSTFATSGDEVSIGRPVVEHVQWLREQQLLPLRELFNVDHDSPIYNESSRRGVFYAESWALMHYLMLGNPERRTQLREFLRLIGTHSTDEAFDRAFGDVTYAKLEQELRAYVGHRAFAYTKYSMKDLDASEASDPQPLERAEVLYAFGHLLAYGGRDNAADATRFLNEALKADPAHAGAYADLGHLYDAAGQRAAADSAFAKAVQLGGNDANVYLQFGNYILQTDPLKARDAFRKAAQLDSNSAPAWAGLGATYVLTPSRDKSEGITALEKSLALVPGDVGAAFYLAQLYAMSGRRADAARLVDGILARSGDARIRDQVQEVLLLADAHEAERLAMSNQVEEASALAHSILAKTKDPSLTTQVNALLAQIDQFTVMRAAVQSLNDAIAKANAGKFSEALAIVDGVLPTITDPEVEQQAKTFRDELTKRMKKQ